MTPVIAHRPRRGRRALWRATSGVALMEFAIVLPVLITMSLTGAELTNYVTTKMRVSQLALQLADDAARMGSGTQLEAKKVSEVDINDLFTGAQYQSGELDLNTNGRVVLSSLEPIASPNTTSKFKVRWKRCFGQKTNYVPQYPRPDQSDPNNLTGIGPVGREVTAQDDNATMFVEVFYIYKPLIGLGSLAPSPSFTEIASMAVRDRRDLSDDTTNPDGTTNPNPQHPLGVYKVTGVTASTC